MKILVVEDEDTIREVEKAYLSRAGFSVDEASDGKSALELFSKNKYDLIVLDLNLPEIDGINVCKEIRKLSQVPVIMVTARVEEIDEIIGLEIGADDYIKKPFSPSVLIARVQSILRRTGHEVIETGGLSIDPERMIIAIKGKEIELTTTQFNILYTLAKRPGKVFTRSEILDYAYDETLPNDVLDRTVDAHVKSIRKAIEPNPKKPKYLLTVIGKGYKFNDELK
ncbi:response regulator transcription factor [Candidatus Dojkabacteria bacterium]|uniref:Response regulator transcription factor n=1 Tax=Candidatus Dojkabacteria bacterium TaxID=2099670 RepID=A0A955LB23_9BACT|nr:response regulator transcription factor [Candidatus Dojkabacteria bacterium]